AHSYVDTVISDATCTQNGSMLRLCSVCGYSCEEEIVTKGHNYVTDDGAYDDPDKFADPTCTDYGWVMKTCSKCGKHEKIYGDTLAPHELVYHKEKVPTATERGNRNYHECTVCGKYFTSKDCHEELTAEEVFYSLPQVIEVDNFGDLLAIAKDMESGSTSYDYYQVSVVVYELSGNRVTVWDDYSDEDLLFAFTAPSNVDASAIDEGDEIVIKGKLYVYKDGTDILMDLVDVEIVSVAQQANSYTLFVESNLDESDGYVGILYDDANYYYANVKYFNALKPAEFDTLTVTYSKYNPNAKIKLLKVLVNGKAATATGGKLTVTVTGDVHVQLIFDYSVYSDLPISSVTVDKFDTMNGNSHEIDEYVSYEYVGGTNEQGRIHQNSHLRFYVNNANVVGIVITYVDYNLDGEKTVLQNTVSVGKSKDNVTAVTQSINGNLKVILSFDASAGYTYVDYFANVCQARIAEITVQYATNNTFEA
ncbi:MAG: hypothetical protein NC332_05625, partial [Firmicutes bacterium]|nr:hypothetical protein [Bacillota bacterium]